MIFFVLLRFPLHFELSLFFLLDFDRRFLPLPHVEPSFEKLQYFKKTVTLPPSPLYDFFAVFLYIYFLNMRYETKAIATHV